MCAIVALVFSLAGPLLRAKAREKDAVQYGAGFSANLPFSEAEVEQVKAALPKPREDREKGNWALVVV